jgi:hypothetical protein
MSGPGRNYWRTLEELAETPEFSAVDRRRFLQLMAASMALGGLPACGPEPNPRQLLPYVEQPPGIVPGRSAVLRDGDDPRRLCDSPSINDNSGPLFQESVTGLPVVRSGSCSRGMTSGH